nr:hypothetical protein GCM10020093_094080 [Planobispora longispora]
MLRLRERKQVKIFLRPDDYGRYISCLIYLPRDRYTTKIRIKMQELLVKALGGTTSDYSAMIGESALARLQVVVRGERGRPVSAAGVDLEELEARLAATTRSWEDDLGAAIAELSSEEEAPGSSAGTPPRSPRGTRPTSRPGWPWPTCGGWRRSPRRATRSG